MDRGSEVRVAEDAEAASSGRGLSLSGDVHGSWDQNWEW